VQARTLEFYQQMGMAEAGVAAGRKTMAANMWVTGRRVAHVVFGELGAALSPFPYALVYPQDEHERFLIERLSEAGVKVERETELVHFQETAEGVAGHLRRADGASDGAECGVDMRADVPVFMQEERGGACRQSQA
jgi:2-polyprenyl-6-methoxyphenol hydroxylase-like FAD-dependent oxidoreductase